MGSIVVGSKSFIEKFRYNRKMLGGGLRQSGFIAAPGLVALRKMRFELKKDHEIALLFTKLLSEIKWIEVVHHP
jgi:threonine aldolase